MIETEIIAQFGFPIAVTCYLLYERSLINKEIVQTLNRIATIIDERLCK
jgi:hypothetical protein